MSIKPIAIFLPNLHGGGAEKAAVNLIKGMVQRNLTVDLILASVEGPYLKQIPAQVRIVNLKTGRVINAIVPLSNYLKREQPQALLSYMGHTNVVACLAKELSRIKTRLVLVEQSTLSASESNLLRARFVPPLMRLLYPRADAIVGCSIGLSRDLEQELGLKKETVQTIYNPIVDSELLTLAQQKVEHPWFQADCPVFLAVGRLTEQKDFLSLLQAFAVVRKQINSRLIILGEGELREELETAAKRLAIAEDVALPGFVDNPYAYMNKADVFVLSSRWEGLGNVVIEAIACGCPVVSTDCPDGPKEILDGGKYGSLVPVGNIEALSKAMIAMLANPVPKKILQERSNYFSLERAVEQYLMLLQK